MVSTHQHPNGFIGHALKPIVASGLVFVIAGLAFDLPDLGRRLAPTRTAQANSDCDVIVQTEARLSREQLANLLTVPERDSKERVQDIVGDPYCRLPELNVRSGVVAKREMYPLEFDPGTQLIILYENDEYAGYRFNFE